MAGPVGTWVLRAMAPCAAMSAHGGLRGNVGPDWGARPSRRSDNRPPRDTRATRYRLRAASPANWVLGAMAAGLTGILRPPRLSYGLCDWRWRPARSRTPATNCPIQRAVKPEPSRIAKAASGLFITWGYTELCLHRNECAIVAKRHQKFPSARGHGLFMVPSRSPCLKWRSLFGAVPFWPLLVPFALLAPFGPFWPLLAPFALMAPFRLLWPSWPLVCILRTPRHNNYCPIRVLGANGPGLVY